MSLFNQRKNKTFNFTAKYQNKKAESATGNLASKWEEIRSTSKRKESKLRSLPIMVLFLIAILVLLYVLSRYE